MRKNKYIYVFVFLLLLSGCSSTDVTVTQTNELPKIAKTILLPPEQAEIPILIYHQIRNSSVKDNINDKTFIVSPDEFERQLAYLKNNNYTPLSFNDLKKYLEGKFTLPTRPVIISFDDGHANQFTNAFPLLKKYDVTATFFIFANPIGKSKNYLTWEQVNILKDAGMEIGGHGWYHLYLTKISDQELEREIIQGKQLIEAKINNNIDVFAYPFGDYNQEIISSLKEAGYNMARDIINGTTHTNDSLFTLSAYFITENFSRFKNIISTQKSGL